MLLATTFGGAAAAAAPESRAAPGPQVAPQALGIPTLWGWVTARHPSRTTPYTPAARDHGSSITGPAGTVTVTRHSRGEYEVAFGGMEPQLGCPADGCDGTAVVTALSTSQRECSATDMWSGGPVLVDVTCTDQLRHAADTIFTLDFVASYDFFNTIAYLWASDKKAANYDPAGCLQLQLGRSGAQRDESPGCGQLQGVAAGRVR